MTILSRYLNGWTRSDVIQALILVVGATYCAVTILLWYQTRQQTSLLSKQTTETIKEFKVEQRPYMVVMAKNPSFTDTHSPLASHPAMANMYITNIGKTPAITMLTQERFLRYRITTDAAYAAFLDSEFSALDKKMADVRGNTIIPFIGQDVAPNAIKWQTEQTDEPLSDADIKELAEGKTHLVYIGVVTYRDAFTDYRTEFCFFWFGTNPEVWHNCPLHNVIR